MLTILGQSDSAGNRVSRRRLLSAAGAGLLGVSLPKLLAAEAGVERPQRRARSAIFLFLFGGPSQLETFDMKPDAPSEIRGPFKAITTRTHGLRCCEHLPRLANVSDKYCIIRSMTHTYNDHSGAGHYLQTGKRWHVPIGGGFDATARDWPAMGSVVEYVAQHGQGRVRRDLPAYAVVPNRLGRLELAGQYLRPGEYGGWLGRAYNPLATKVDKRNASDNPYWRTCTDDELTFEIDGLVSPRELTLVRLHGRLTLAGQLNEQRRLFERSRSVEEFDRFNQRALALASSTQTQHALDIKREDVRVRDRYGRHLFGQSCLMARRLVEAGVRFVTVHYEACDGYSWDSHVNSEDVKNHLLPTFDQGAAALLSDLDDRGLLEETLVVALGEMGRTPRANGTWGRGHWSTLFPALIAGAGVRRGSLHGSSDKQAAYPVDQPTSPEDLAATIYHALGIDPELRLPDSQGRPTPIVEGGRALTEIFG